MNETADAARPLSYLRLREPKFGLQIEFMMSKTSTLKNHHNHGAAVRTETTVDTGALQKRTNKSTNKLTGAATVIYNNL